MRSHTRHTCNFCRETSYHVSRVDPETTTKSLWSDLWSEYFQTLYPLVECPICRFIGSLRAMPTDCDIWPPEPVAIGKRFLAPETKTMMQFFWQMHSRRSDASSLQFAVKALHQSNRDNTLPTDQLQRLYRWLIERLGSPPTTYWLLLAAEVARLNGEPARAETLLLGLKSDDCSSAECLHMVRLLELVRQGDNKIREF